MINQLIITQVCTDFWKCSLWQNKKNHMRMHALSSMFSSHSTIRVDRYHFCMYTHRLPLACMVLSSEQAISCCADCATNVLAPSATFVCSHHLVMLFVFALSCILLVTSLRGSGTPHPYLYTCSYRLDLVRAVVSKKFTAYDGDGVIA